jgi:peptide chain release factor
MAMETKIIQITSGKGPAECCLAVALALKEMLKEAKASGLQHEIIDRFPAQENGTLASATLKLDGKGVATFAESWKGALLWIAQSPYRKFHKRKNWFIGISVYDMSMLPEWKEKDITFQTMRSSGPGGQNVNKVESAVRALHVPSGVQVAVSDSRSQLQNKKLAVERLKEAFTLWQITVLQKTQQEQWQNHNELERGNPARTYAGKEFKRTKTHGTA